MNRELTEGEKRVLKDYCLLETHANAAQDLGISTQTLKNHLGSIYKKVDRRKAHSTVYQLAIMRTGIDPITGEKVGEPMKFTTDDQSAPQDTK